VAGPTTFYGERGAPGKGKKKDSHQRTEQKKNSGTRIGRRRTKKTEKKKGKEIFRFRQSRGGGEREGGPIDEVRERRWRIKRARGGKKRGGAKRNREIAGEKWVRIEKMGILIRSGRSRWRGEKKNPGPRSAGCPKKQDKPRHQGKKNPDRLEKGAKKPTESGPTPLKDRAPRKSGIKRASTIHGGKTLPEQKPEPASKKTER